MQRDTDGCHAGKELAKMWVSAKGNRFKSHRSLQGGIIPCSVEFQAEIIG